MNRDLIMRRTLQITTAFNLVGAVALAFPDSSLGQQFGLPTEVPVVYRVFASGAIALFGFAYAWLSVQPTMDRPLVALSIWGKLIAFTSLVVLAVFGQVPAHATIPAVADLLFALIFIWWWLNPQSEARVAARS